MRVYMDHNASTPPRPQAIAALIEALWASGNPSSSHVTGRAARKLVEDAREQVAALIGATPDGPYGVVFTSGGTEANALALAGVAPERLLVSAIEHDSVLQAVEGTTLIPVDSDGVIILAALESLLVTIARNSGRGQGQGRTVVALMLANNETGILQPVAEAARLAHAHGALLHCDAVQAAGRLPVDMARLGADTLALSAHKMGGPQGVGALVAASHVALEPLFRGGGQERRRRAGTENVPGIAGFGVAAVLALQTLGQMEILATWRDRLEREAAKIAPVQIFGAKAPRLPNTSCLALDGVAANVQLMALDLAGVAVSAGAACSSGKTETSHVLRAMGVAEGAINSAIRVSLGWNSREGDVDRFLAAWGALAGRYSAGLQ